MATQFDPIAKDESLNTTEATPRNIADVLAEGLKGIEDALPPNYTEGDGIDISNNEISVDTTFTEASTRANIASGDSFSTILGKIKKFFTDLKAVAFSGAAADVTYGAGSVEDALDEFSKGVTFPPNAYITTAGGSATASKDGFAGGTFIQSPNDNRAAWITVNGNQVAYIGGASYVDMPMVFLYYVHAGDVIETRSGVGKYHILVP